MSEEASLRLAAEDGADLEVISAAVQDALVRVEGLAFDRRARRFTLTLDRFRHEAAHAAPPYERVQSALSLEGVLAIKTKRLRRDAPQALASILSLRFDPDPEPPGGTVHIILAGGGEIALTVECVDAALFDIGAPWRTPRRPAHDE
ncbi:MAG: DUF2948 family protein [Alphaproteobacteria bacterium]|nr:DUF2948 family protein [Alphaproteobacteria bacterium]